MDSKIPRHAQALLVAARFNFLYGEADKRHYWREEWASDDNKHISYDRNKPDSGGVHVWISITRDTPNVPLAYHVAVYAPSVGHVEWSDTVNSVEKCFALITAYRLTGTF